MGRSLAVGQRSLGDPELRYPLLPPLTAGCPKTSTAELAYPVEVDYEYGGVPRSVFAAATAPHGGDGSTAGLDRWAPLLPPLNAPGLGEGGTPVVQLEDGVFVKDESRNPTWSHKDRLNRCTVSAALACAAPGVVVASSGNHGASAAAYAARAGLRCVVLLSAGAPPAVQSFVRAYGAVVLTVARGARWPLLRRIVDDLGLHPVSNMTVTHTGHPFGPEGYKPIAYELVEQLGLPAAVFVPTGYGELLYGVWKGFDELHRLGVTDGVPRLYSCEPAAGGPLAAAMARHRPAATVDTGPTGAYAIGCSVGGYRGVLALTRSNGQALRVDDDELAAAQLELARAGLWQELSGAAGLAGLRQLLARSASRPAGGEANAFHHPDPDHAERRTISDAFGGPVVCIATSSGFKDLTAGQGEHEIVAATWGAVRARLRGAGL
jgi:threonine synthase